MKYGLNINIILDNKWGGLVVKELNSILWVQGSNFMMTCIVVIIEYWPNIMYMPKLPTLYGYLGEPKQVD
jgi:hypothetical protein